MRLLLVLLLTALTARDAGALAWRELDKDYTRTTVSTLKRLEATREHARFVLRRRVELYITDSDAHMNPGAFASYNLQYKVMYMDKDRLMNGAMELKEMGFRTDEIGDILAWKTLPIIVHELTHAMTDARSEKNLGVRFLLTVLEDELICFFDELLALQELFGQRPVLWHRGMILDIDRVHADMLLAWKKDEAALRRHVRRLYPHLPSLETASRGELLEHARAFTEAAMEDLQKVRRTRRKCAKSKGSEGCASAAELARSERVYRERLRWGKGTERFLSTEEGLDRVREFYSAEVERRLERLRSVREALRGPGKEPAATP